MKPIMFLVLCIFQQLNYSQIQLKNDGSIPLIDGNIVETEWNDALNLDLNGGEFVKVKKNGHYLFIALKGKQGGFSSVCINFGDTVSVLHSSTNLITANYVLNGNKWILTKEFSALKNSKRNVQNPEHLQLKEFGWNANLVSVGDPSETEFKIDTRKFGKELNISIVFYQFKAKIRYAKSPPNLKDGSLNKNLIEGGRIGQLLLSPEGWLRVKIL